MTSVRYWTACFDQKLQPFRGFLLVSFLCTCSPVWASGITAIWANDGEDKVTQNELRASQNPAGVHNCVWDGAHIKLFGAKNEVVSFNLILEARAAAARNISVIFNHLTGPSGYTLASSPAHGDGVFNWT